MAMNEAERAGRWAFGGLVLWLAATVLWWAVAFWRLPAATPEWLIRAQAICFGTTVDGLPAPYGWISLVGTPGSLLGVLLTVWGGDLRTDLARRWRRPAGRALLVGLVLVPAVGLSWVGWRVARGVAADATPIALQTGQFPQHYPRLDTPLPDFTLIDQHGKTVTPATLRGELLLLTFAFAHCNTVCPTTVGRLARAGAELSAPHRLVVITLDAWRDTPSALAGWAERWELGPRATLLSGDVLTVNGLLDRLDIVRDRDPATGDIAHPNLVYVVDPRGRIAYILNAPSRAWIVQAAERVIAGEDGLAVR